MSVKSKRRFTIHKAEIENQQFEFVRDVRDGLLSEPKFLLAKYFYDPLGSALFEAITLLPEYYLTRAEMEILTE